MATEDQLNQYLMEQLERRKRQDSPEYQKSLAADRMGESQSNARNALAAALSKSAAQVGTLDGKSADASAPGDLAQALSGSNKQFYSGLGQERADSENRFMGNAKLMQYLQEKKDKQAQTTEQNKKKLLAESDKGAALKESTRRWEAEMKLKSDALKQAKELADTKATAEKPKRTVASDVGQKIGQFDAAMSQVDDLAKEWRDKTGFFSGATQYLPGTDAAKYADAQALSAQSIGQIVEGGKLTDSDYERYKSMMPTAGDSAERAELKFNRLKQYIAERKRTSIEGAGQAGYDTSAFKQVEATPVSLSNDGQAIAAPPKAPPPGKVRVVSPQGKIGFIPQDQLEQALSEGYKEAP